MAAPSLIQLSEQVTRLPAVRRHIEQIVEDLRADRCVIWYVPQLAPAKALCTALREACEGGFGSCPKLVWLGPETDTSAGLPRFLATRVLRLGGTDWDASTLLKHPGTPSVLIIAAQGGVGNQSAQAARLVRDRVMKAHAVEGFRDGVPKVVAVLSEPTQVPDDIQAHPAVQFRSFRRLLSCADIHTILRMCVDSGTSPADRLWVRAVYTEVAGDDLALLAWLPSCEIESIGDMIEALVRYPEPFVPLNGTQTDAAWFEGRLQELAEQDAMDHAVVAARGKDDRALTHRAWRGQIRLLMPLIDEARVSLCWRLTKSLGESWPQIAPPDNPNSVDSSGLHPTTEWGHLRCIWQSDQVRSRVDLYGTQDTVGTLWIARNELAHYKPLSRDQFAKTLGALWNLGIGRGLGSS